MLLHGRLSILSKLFLNYSATVSVAVLSAFKESAAAAAAIGIFLCFFWEFFQIP